MKILHQITPTKETIILKYKREGEKNSIKNCNIETQKKLDDILHTTNTNKLELIELLEEEIPLYETERRETIHGYIKHIEINEGEISVKCEYTITDLTKNIKEKREITYIMDKHETNTELEYMTYKIIEQANKILKGK